MIGASNKYSYMPVAVMVV